MRRIISPHLAPFLLVIIVLVLWMQNFTPNTFLSGWDTLHPEFNFGEYFRRIIFGVWQEHQGLGAVASQAHIAEIPRMILYYPLSFILSQNLLRYFYIFLCLLLGPLGVYFFLKRLGKLPAFLASLFYLLNLVTVQQFYVPLEMFTTHYATLPWIFLTAVEYLHTGSKKFLLLFSIISFFAAPMAHTATLWYVFFLAFGLFLLVSNLVIKEKKLRFLSAKLVISSLVVNMFWLLPNFYFILNHAQEVGASKIHTLFTEEAFAQNASFGNIQSLSFFKNFLFNWGQYTGDGKFEPLLLSWSKHLENPLVSLLGIAFFLIILVGIYYSIKTKSIVAIPMLSLFVLSVFFWLNVNPPLGFLFDFLQNTLSLFKEALRFPFTKLSILLIFSSSYFFAFGVLFFKKFNLYHLFTLIVFLSLLYYSLPAFQGQLIDPRMRTKIPSEYFQMFNWINKQADGRVASLPINSFWGWTYYNFDYQGAGFLWFGIKQPLLDREFDRWQKYNEEYYREMSQAVYSKNPELFKNVLTKYDISYILVDKNVIAPQIDQKVLYLPEIQNLIESDPQIQKAAQFGKNLFVYKLPSKYPTYLIDSAKNITPVLAASYEDQVFQEYGSYQTAQNYPVDSSFPFRNLIDNQNRILPNKIKIIQEGVLLKTDSKLSLQLPKFEDMENNFAVDLVVERQNGSTLEISLLPKFPKSEVPFQISAQLPPGEKNFLLSVNNSNNFILNNPSENTPLFLGTVFLNTNSQNTISLYLDHNDQEINPDFSTLGFDLVSCGKNQNTFGITPRESGFDLFGKGTDVCLNIPLQNLFQQPPNGEFLLQTTFQTQTSSWSFCLADLNGSCLNSDLKNISSVPLASKTQSFFFNVKTDQMPNLRLKFELFSDDNKLNRVSFDNLTFSLKKPLFTSTFGKDLLSLSLDSLKNLKDNNILIPFSGYESLSQDITKSQKTSGDCQSAPGLVSNPTKEIVREQTQNYIHYKSQDGSFCDHFSYSNLPRSQGYLIIVRSRNIEGLPIRLCVSNPASKRCDIYAHLTRDSKFTNDIFLLPPMGTDASGFDININNYAIKNIPAINDLASIYIVPFPYNWLQRIETGTKKTQAQTKIVASVKNNKSFYVVDVKDAKAGNTLVLSQAFEKGWHAYYVDNSLAKIAPQIFGTPLRTHVLVDSWANGFIIDKDIKEAKIAIIFLPQYLEYVGFAVLIAGVFAFYWSRLKNLKLRP